jgi:hypothetical protein
LLGPLLLAQAAHRPSEGHDVVVHPDLDVVVALHAFLTELIHDDTLDRRV